MKKTLRLAAAAALLPLAVGACGSGDARSGQADGELTYWLWDSNQVPAYQACATAFEAENPGTKIKIEQFGWADYWNKITTGLVAGNAPDVFVNHLNYYPTFAAKNQILPIDEQVEEAGISTDVYPEGLADVWVSQDGKRYGLPKDFDTIGIFYNKDLLAEAGVDESTLADLTWNPEDGGTYEDLIAHLTVDANGVRGDEPGFDKSKVEVYGLGLDENNGAGVGQQIWSMYALSTGWQFTDENPWGSEFQYDDPRFQATIAWFKGLIDKGYMPDLATSRAGVSVNDAFGAGKYALSTNGSWMIGSYFGYDGVDVGVAPVPVGPSGERATIFNGVADSIYAGTDDKEGAWKWVEHLASADCQKKVAEAAVVFPSLPEALEVAEEEFAAKGVDVSAFTLPIEEGATHLYPITDHAPEIAAIMGPAMDAVLAGEADASSLTEANEQVNALFQ
ncbi:multiple sugar transport system substrate-binding protein [Kineococcus xinjiangensis]|uniref:Multiple sugar transport system substrate-binding protein n=1 Tax=Kineococcus xinjiangensis TaxID=512762 RepID=A0A2S6IWM6_9ACTN|nr:sugar ABC transporter substrate-binding protein [Kineococcus xinjiangensis]PPK98685.1 multiple sugar transport system substrate-binding protein [Kineococcus xinjiangensis]